VLSEMRELAVLELNRRLGTEGCGLAELRESHASELARSLVESGDTVERVYLLQRGDDDGAVRMWVEELDDDKRARLPFNQGTGARSPALGPVLKRTFKKGKQPPYGPTPNTQRVTRKRFEALADGESEWAEYFAEVCEVLFRGRSLIYQEQRSDVATADQTILNLALASIDEKSTVFVAVVDSEGRWPGDRPAYRRYLAAISAASNYSTGKAPPRPDATCPLCGRHPVTLYPNAVKGAGLNLGNIDRAGAFPGLDESVAWKSYGLCVDCADALYVYARHLLKDYKGKIAGETALLIPALLGPDEEKPRFLRDWHAYVANLEGGAIRSREEDLLEFCATRDDAQVVLQILWATFDQLVDEIRGCVTDILPSRLRALADHNRAANTWAHPLAPRHPLDELRLDLPLSCLKPLLHRPGGRKTTKSNAGQRLFELRRQLAHALYHGRPLGAAEGTMWTELIETARAHLGVIAEGGRVWGLLHETPPGKRSGAAPSLTLASWVRHLARFLHCLNSAEMLSMSTSDTPYTPESERLEPYFASGSGIDTPEKAFAFTLGIVYGKLLQVQGARDVNVSSNALTWLKRLNLSGHDLPELYVKIREKLLAYETEASGSVREVLGELGRLGARLGDRISLDPVPTCYFLLLGQSVSLEVLESKKTNGEQG